MGWMAPLRHLSAKLLSDRNSSEWEPSMGEVTTIGLDLAKHVFQVHGVDAEGGCSPTPTSKKKSRPVMSRSSVISFPFGRLTRLASPRRQQHTCARHKTSVDSDFQDTNRYVVQRDDNKRTRNRGIELTEWLSLPKTRFERIDGVAHQGSDTRQYLRIARLAVCRAHPSRAKREFELRFAYFARIRRRCSALNTIR
jgi:hypothetical protein